MTAAGNDGQVNPRIQNFEELVALGLPYLPNRFGPTRHATELRCDFEALEGTRVQVAGRLVRIRVMGKASFAHVLDETGELQLYFKRDTLGDEQYQYFKLLDIGDIVGVEGTVFKTRTGEVSVQVEHCVLLAKAYQPLPDKWHGLVDVETRYRRRYLDLISNSETRETFRVRSAVVRTIRKYLDERGFLEMETPILQPLYGGAAATPFTTHYRTLDTDVYLRIADELYLKRLIVGGFERVYEISKDFRNEGFSRKHSPEFTMLEFYWAYADYHDVMALTEDMVSQVAQAVLGTMKVPYGDWEIDLAPPWRRLSVDEALVTYAGMDPGSFTDRAAVLTALERHNIQANLDDPTGALVEELASELVEPHLIQPTFLIDFPIDFPGSLLAKRSKANPGITERLEPYMAGFELGNGFTELNDPFDQLARMEEANKLKGEAYQEIDRDYVFALEHGMPPTGGLGLGIDRLTMVLTNSQHIRETILFPLLRQQKEGAHVEP